jgi:hypothetical protein
LYEQREFKGLSDEEIKKRREEHMYMVAAPILEALDRGEI